MSFIFERTLRERERERERERLGQLDVSLRKRSIGV